MRFWLLLNDNLNLLLWNSNRLGMASFYTDGDCFINIYCLFLYILILLRYFKVRTEVSFSTQEGLLRNTGYSEQRFLCTDYSDRMPNQGESGKNKRIVLGARIC